MSQLEWQRQFAWQDVFRRGELGPFPARSLFWYGRSQKTTVPCLVEDVPLKRSLVWGTWLISVVINQIWLWWSWSKKCPDGWRGLIDARRVHHFFRQQYDPFWDLATLRSLPKFTWMFWGLLVDFLTSPTGANKNCWHTWPHDTHMSEVEPPFGLFFRSLVRACRRFFVEHPFFAGLAMPTWSPFVFVCFPGSSSRHRFTDEYGILHLETSDFFRDFHLFFAVGVLH